MRIDTVSVVPTGSSLVESVYSTDTENLSQVAHPEHLCQVN